MVDRLVAAQSWATAACGRTDPARVAVRTAYGGIDLGGARDVLAASNFRGGVGDE
ncbi:hypothetical protein [Nocardia sp. NPDC004604]|uniref:hypothetical protein n=1 Tax=Nocardia sp. NPDC004604 TaxID=3157013 RepID=UPI0033B7A65B